MNQNPWEVSLAEHQANGNQFAALGPQNGRIDGNSARTVLMKSNLPPQILAQIWTLADIDCDGMLDLREFSIAMRLTRNCLAGLALPTTLPPSLLTVPALSGFESSVPMGTNSNGMNVSSGISSISYGTPLMQPVAPVYNTFPIAIGGIRNVPISAGHSTSGKQCGNWTIPHQTKLRYSQQFNQLDKQRMGFLSGSAGRSAMGMSGLPTPTLAHIWSLSDVNKDGRLSVDEFCIAMHLIDMCKAGFALPDQTPAELAAICGISRSANNSPQLEPGAPPAQKSPALKTFEDKRMDNFARGQAELERRRQILIEEENRRRAEVEKREREEEERRAREQLEKERQRRLEKQAEIERLRILDEARLEMEKKREAEREATRKEAERQRQIETDKIRLREMQAQKQQEAERTAQRQQRQKTLGFQLQALDEKAKDTDIDITKARKRITEITKEIETMRDQRDDKMRRIAELQSNNQQLSVRAQELAHQLLQLQSANKETISRKTELEETKKRRDLVKAVVAETIAQLEIARQRTAVQKEIAVKKRNEYNISRKELIRSREKYRKVLDMLNELQVQAREELYGKNMDAVCLNEKECDGESDEHLAKNTVGQSQISKNASMQVGLIDKHGSFGTNSLPQASASGTTKYRALFEFTARSEDELSFQPGDVVLVFEAHAAEPGWKAGQIRDKVGWFPEAFAEPIGTVLSSISQPIQNMPPNMTPSPSLDRIPEETSVKSSVAIDVASAPVAVICHCVAQFPWKARNDGDLSFSKGDPIEVIEQQEMKWRGRKTDGSVGWFPKSYVKICQNNSSLVSHSVEPKKLPIDYSVDDIPSPQQNLNGNASVTQQISQFGVVHEAVTSTLHSDHKSLSSLLTDEWFTAMFDFDAAEPTDLSLKVGDHILVTERNEAWWKGRCNGKEGIFPANYVQKSEAPSSTTLPVFIRVRAVADFDGTAANQLSLRIGDIVTVREKSTAGWWEGETVRDGLTLTGWFPGDYVTPLEKETGSDCLSATAIFDYDANQTDELSFRAGDIIKIMSKVDAEWWSGYRVDSPFVKGLFPANYVQLSREKPSYYYGTEDLYVAKFERGGKSLYNYPPKTSAYDLPPGPSEAIYDFPPTWQNTAKFHKLVQELHSTEVRYLSDLQVAKKLFYDTLIHAVSQTELDSVFLNWDQLIEVSTKLITRMEKNERPGMLFIAEIDSLSAFVFFCSHQKAAIEALQLILQKPDVRKLYVQCCEYPCSRGMTLSSFLLLPLARVTRYPLLVEKMLIESKSQNKDQDLDTALQLLRALVAEINRTVSEIDNISLLCWSQTHVRCHALINPIEFATPTRLLGERMFLHSGVLYKQRSGRLLVGLLFNDFLMLTTPDGHIDSPEAFKVTKATDIQLCLYKQPLLLSYLSLNVLDEDETTLSLKFGDESINLRCVNRNAHRLWFGQLEQAIDLCAISLSEQSVNNCTIDNSSNGRLLVEIIGLRNIFPKLLGQAPHLIRISLSKVVKYFDINVSEPDLHITTQLPISSTSEIFMLALFQKKLYSQDILILDETEVPLTELVTESLNQRGPLLKSMLLRSKYLIKMTIGSCLEYR